MSNTSRRNLKPTPQTNASRWWIPALAGMTLLISTVALADALVTTEEESLEELADAIGADPQSRFDAIALYLEPERQSVRARLFGEREIFEDELLAMDAIRNAAEGDLDTIQSNVQVADDYATVAVRLRDQEGPLDVTLGLRKRGERWLIHEMTVR